MENALQSTQEQSLQYKAVVNPEDIIPVFLSSCDVRESSKELYKRTLTQFFRWVEATGRVFSTLTALDIIAYKRHLIEEAHLETFTTNSYLVAVRKFYSFLEGAFGTPNIAKGVKNNRVKSGKFYKMHLTEKKSKELLEYFKGEGLRNFAIVNLLLRTGLRTVEVIRLNIEDITFKGERRVLKVWGKGRDTNDNFVILTDKAYLPLKEYIDGYRRGAKGKEPLFVSTSNQNKGERLTTRSIRGICKEGFKAIGLDSKEFSAHSLRHTTGVEILKRGGTLDNVQSVLRHNSPVTSQIYVQSVKEELRLEKAPELLLEDAF